MLDLVVSAVVMVVTVPKVRLVLKVLLVKPGATEMLDLVKRGRDGRDGAKVQRS